jgi:hypothetical protein
MVVSGQLHSLAAFPNFAVIILKYWVEEAKNMASKCPLKYPDCTMVNSAE